MSLLVASWQFFVLLTARFQSLFIIIIITVIVLTIITYLLTYFTASKMSGGTLHSLAT